MPSGPRSKPAAMYGITRGARSWKVTLTRNGVAFFKQFGFRCIKARRRRCCAPRRGATR